jgi:type I restriction enzyme, S subunit
VNYSHTINLPTSWTLSPLSDVAEINPKLDKANVADSLEVSFVPMPAVQATTGEINVTETRQFGQVKKGYTAFRQGDVLFAKITPCMENGKMAIVPKVCNDLAFGSTEFHVLRARSGINAHYIYHFVSSQRFRYDAEHNMTGAVGQRRVPTTYLSDHLIPIPPTRAQDRIVAKIEELFSELDNGIENLKAAKAQLLIYRQAVLKHAFEGKLTARWREKNKGKLESADQLLTRINALSKKKSLSFKAAESIDLPEIPTQWLYSRLENLGDLGRGKSKHRPRNDPKLFGGRYPFIQTGDVKAANHIISGYSQTYSEFGLQQSKLWPAGTLCITIAANIAETAFLGFDSCFPDSIVGFSAKKELVLLEYVDFFIKSVKARIEAYAPATAQKNINLNTLENLIVPVCSLKEQKILVEHLENAFSIIHELEKEIEKNINKSEILRQTILTKAFSGELTAQNPNDEPASALLKRICAEKTSSKPAAIKTKEKRKAA